MGAVCRLLRSGADVPHLFFLMFVCLFGLIATCAML